MTRTNVASGGKLEPVYGYSRAVRVGSAIKVSGTCAVGPDGETVGVGDAAEQAARCYEIIGMALEAAGASLGDIVINRVYLTNIEDADAVGRVHGEIFSEVKPCCTMMAVSKLVKDEFLVEIESEAIVSEDPHENPGTTH